MNKKSTSLAIIAALTISASFTSIAHAQEGKGVGFDDINNMCIKVTNKPESGLQHDGEKANLAVLQMTPGMYSYPNEGALLLFTNDNYLLKLPKSDKPRTIFGTDGDDMLLRSGIVGGCYKEQLSEALQRNELDPSLLRLQKSYE